MMDLSPSNDPNAIEYYDPSTGYITYNGSIYTGDSNIA